MLRPLQGLGKPDGGSSGRPPRISLDLANPLWSFAGCPVWTIEQESKGTLHVVFSKAGERGSVLFKRVALLQGWGTLYELVKPRFCKDTFGTDRDVRQNIKKGLLAKACGRPVLVGSRLGKPGVFNQEVLWHVPILCFMHMCVCIYIYIGRIYIYIYIYIYILLYIYIYMRVQLHAYAKACIYWYMKKKTALRPKRADFSRTTSFV